MPVLSIALFVPPGETTVIPQPHFVRRNFAQLTSYNKLVCMSMSV